MEVILEELLKMTNCGKMFMAITELFIYMSQLFYNLRGVINSTGRSAGHLSKIVQEIA